jgi:hypothetical protein
MAMVSKDDRPANPPPTTHNSNNITFHFRIHPKSSNNYLQAFVNNMQLQSISCHYSYSYYEYGLKPTPTTMPQSTSTFIPTEDISLADHVIMIFNIIASYLYRSRQRIPLYGLNHKT